MLRNSSRAGAAMVAALLTAGLTTGAASGAASGVASAGDSAETFAAKARQAKGASSAVTLITGDRVHVDAEGRVTRVEPAKGREGVRITVNRIAGATYVLPSDASRLVAQGKLDRRLFNVSRLIEDRYDDAHRGTLPLIVSYARAAEDKARAKSAISAADVSVRRVLPAVKGEAVTAPKTGTSEVWRALTAAGERRSGERTVAPGIERVWLDGKRRASLDKSVPQIGAPTAWQAGYDGKGVKIAVLDTGVDETHPDLKGVELAQKDFSGSGNTVDHFGHGTHVASTAAGSGAKSGGKYKGVAPGAKILDGKVLDDSGFGDDSGIIAGMQWAADQGAKVANLSLGGGDTTETDPLEAAVDKLSAEKGVLFVIAAGNDGPAAETVGSPGSAASALTVGAVDRNDKIADFSSVGPTADGSLKPDITAPGVDIVAAKAAQGQIGDPAADGYVSMSGTSMATPHVAGAAAILAQEHPDWTGQRIKQTLTASAKPGAGLTAHQQGTGRADVARAITQTVVSEQTSLGFGTQQWPHADDKPVTKQITYRNSGTKPVTLDLSVETAGPKGKPAPAGFFALGAKQVTVPAGGTANVGLTADTRIGTLDGTYSGAVTAKAAEGGQQARTSFAVTREVESYDLTLKFIDTKGKPAQAESTVYGLTADFWKNPYDTDGDGVAKIRVPKGSYLLDVPVQTPKGGDTPPDIALMVQPKISVTKNATVTFDARKAKPVSITAPDSAKQLDTYLNYVLESGDSAFGSTWYLDSFKGFRTAQVGAALPAKQFSSQLGGTWQKGSTSYNLLYNRAGSLYTGFSHTASKSELALVNIKIGASAKGRKGTVNPFWSTPMFGVGTVTQPFALPATAKTYVTAPQGFDWEFNIGQDGTGEEGGVYLQSDPPRTYQAKKTYEKTYNVGVFSPKVDANNTAQRLGSELAVCVPEFTDGAGHFGHSEVSKQRTLITADGKKIVDAKDGLCQFVTGLPAKSAAYRISTDASRSTTVAGVSTRITAAWTFASKKPAGDTIVTLPLSTVRFAPKLDLGSAAAAGKKLTVPLALQGPAAGKGFKSLSVQVSYDGGTTWAKAPVTTAKDGKKSLSLSHPKTAKSVSFKAKLTDTSGNTYETTVVKAYLLK
ncbi:S8 family peptidase [Streptomyces scopuliridis]|uniref:S8 family peptidase n=1 Tax=Streptomyces scopuliridis TaxID=452529 RepID=A0ACD4ZFI3_9ACTN|nr:S8 family peptidase [Streptomyces scopuliridis]WSB97139.1 S8 family peptidase [Streptomyces scopuliridis]WSC09157.1 S8 family peptidase [Streptomyces scopuliridis]